MFTFVEKLELKKLLTYGTLAIIGIYCILYVAYISYFAVDFPIQDDLLFILLVDDFIQTGFSFGKIPYFFGELFRVDNDHCLMVPRVINLLNYAIAKSLNFKFQIILVSGFTITVLGLLYRQFTHLQKPVWLFLPVVFFLLQPQYYEVSLWALAGLEHVGVVLFLIGALISLKANKTALALLLASLGTFTSGNGIFIFGALILYIFLEKRYRKLIPIIAVLLGNIILLLLIYKKGQQNNLSESLSHLTELITYMLFLIGGISEGLTSSKSISILLGVLVVMLFIALVFRKLRSSNFQVSSLFLSIMSFNLITLALVALGRFNVGQLETASRYQYYTAILFCATYLAVVSLKSTIKFGRIFGGFIIFGSFIFNIFSFYTYTETVSYNQRAYLADEVNWKQEEHMFYIKPAFVNLVRPYFAATTANGIWRPNPDLNVANFQKAVNTLQNKVKLFEQNFTADLTTDLTDKNNFILEIKNLPDPPNFNTIWYVLISKNATNETYVLPIRFLANGKTNILFGESYFRNYGYVKVFQKSLENGMYKVELVCKSSEGSTRYFSDVNLQIADKQVFMNLNR